MKKKLYINIVAGRRCEKKRKGGGGRDGGRWGKVGKRRDLVRVRGRGGGRMKGHSLKKQDDKCSNKIHHL